MRTYSSNEEFFQHVRDLVARLRAQGHASAADELAEGLAGLNGLTDGWALLMEGVAGAIRLSGGPPDPPLARELKDLLAATRKVVYR